MMVPCMVMIALYWSGPMGPHPGIEVSGHASCHRMMYAEKPPIIAISADSVMYCLPMTLWSVEKM